MAARGVLIGRGTKHRTRSGQCRRCGRRELLLPTIVYSASIEGARHRVDVVGLEILYGDGGSLLSPGSNLRTV